MVLLFLGQDSQERTAWENALPAPFRAAGFCGAALLFLCISNCLFGTRRPGAPLCCIAHRLRNSCSRNVPQRVLSRCRSILQVPRFPRMQGRCVLRQDGKYDPSPQIRTPNDFTRRTRVRSGRNRTSIRRARREPPLSGTPGRGIRTPYIRNRG